MGGSVAMLAAIHFAAAVVIPVFVALIIALVVAPLHTALQRRGLAAWLSLVVLLLGLVACCVVGLVVLVYSLGNVGDRLAFYATRWTAELEQLDAWLQSAGISSFSTAGLLPPEAAASAFGVLMREMVGLASSVVVVVILTVFLLAEGKSFAERLRFSLGEQNPTFLRLMRYGRDIGRYFALRAAVNAVTGSGVAIALFVLGVDFPLLWGIVTFFLSFIPYIGMFLASVPSVLLALAEFGPGRAIVVIIALTVVNALAENLLQPALMSRGLRLSPTFVFVSLLFWTFLLGGGGSFLAIPLSLGAVAMLANYRSSRWLAEAVTVCPPEEETCSLPSDASSVR
jgi:predicted PurR-regulated permease PerM